MTKRMLGIMVIILICSVSLLTSCDEKVTGIQSEQLSALSVSASGSDSENPSSSADTADSSMVSSDGSSNGSQISSAASSSSQEASSTVKSQTSSSGGSNQVSSAASSAVQSSSASSSTASNKKYYVAGSWNGYLVNDEFFEMQLVSGTQTWYTITVPLTEAQWTASGFGGGHWYKVTEGNWQHSYGTDNYVLQPAPVKVADPWGNIGLGSIWIDDKDITLTILFDTVGLVVYDNADGKTLPTP